MTDLYTSDYNPYALSGAGTSPRDRAERFLQFWDMLTPRARKNLAGIILQQLLEERCDGMGRLANQAIPRGVAEAGVVCLRTYLKEDEDAR